MEQEKRLKDFKIEYHGPSIIEAETKEEARKIAMDEVDISVWEAK